MVEFNKKMFSADLAARRHFERNRSQRDICKEIGVSDATISRIENGQVPRADIFVKIVSWLNVPIERYYLKKEGKK